MLFRQWTSNILSQFWVIRQAVRKLILNELFNYLANFFKWHNQHFKVGFFFFFGRDLFWRKNIRIGLTLWRNHYKMFYGLCLFCSSLDIWKRLSFLIMCHNDPLHFNFSKLSSNSIIKTTIAMLSLEEINNVGRRFTYNTLLNDTILRNHQ